MHHPPLSQPYNILKIAITIINKLNFLTKIINIS